MNLHKTHPEAHDAWLYAMGIDVRWRHRSAPVTVDNSVPLLADVPAPITQARYWLIGSEPLNAAQMYVLAGMMWAINADTHEVIYSTPTELEPSSEQRMSTALAAWPQLRALAVPEDLLAVVPHILDQHPHMYVVIFQDEKNTALRHQRLIQLPSLRAMCEDSLKKQLAWAALKSLRA